MKKIAAVEKALASKEAYKASGINSTVCSAYKESKISEKEFIDFNNVIWDNEVLEIVKQLKEFDVKQFTISSGYSNLLDTVQVFVDNGCTVKGLIKINKKSNWNNEVEQIPALLIEL